MAFPTRQAFVHYGGWDAETRSHPCLKWMEDYTNAIDAKDWNSRPFSDWMTSDHSLVQSTGHVIAGGEASWSALAKDIYAPFSAYYHYATFCVAWEDDQGEWEMFGTATLYYNLGMPGHGQKIKGKDGKEWDGQGPSAFHFRFKKQADESLRLAQSSIYADSTMAMIGMLRRGMMNPQDLMG